MPLLESNEDVLPTSVCTRVCCLLGRPQASRGTPRGSPIGHFAMQVRQRFRDLEDNYGGVLTLHPPEQLQNYFQRLNHLGGGGFGTVFRARPLERALRAVPALQANHEYAVKSVPLPSRDHDIEEIEASSLRVSLGRHQEVIEAMMSVQLSTNHVLRTFAKIAELPRTLYIVMELLDGPDMLDWIIDRGKPVSEQEAAQLTRQMLTALHHLHRVVGVLHRDVKLENFGFGRQLSLQRPLPPIKLFDFGLVTILPAPVSEATASDLISVGVGGTPEWMAPEAWQMKCGAGTDVWGVGMILHALLLGRMGFEIQACVEFKDFPHALKKNELTLGTELSAPARDLLQKLLAKDPSQRISTQRALDTAWLLVPGSSASPSNERIVALPSKTKRMGDSTYWKSVARSSMQNIG